MDTKTDLENVNEKGDLPNTTRKYFKKISDTTCFDDKK